jgi:Protein of unknown function (DUF4242)
LGVFVDHHARADVSTDAWSRGLDAAERQIPNADGACPIDYLVAPGGGIFCITDAPDAVAVERLHAELGLPPPTVISVDGADGGRPLSEHDLELVIRLIG